MKKRAVPSHDATPSLPLWDGSGETIPTVPVVARRLADMHAMYGKVEGARCRGCQHLLRYRQSKAWYKCEQTTITHGEGTDWSPRWQACGLYDSGGEAPPMK